MTTHLIVMKPTRYAQHVDARPSDMDTWETDIEINVENRYQSRDGRKIRHSLHFSGSDNCNRSVTGSPMHQHSHAFLNPLPTVIAAHPLPVPDAIDVEIGDLIVLTNLDTVLRVVAGASHGNTGVEVITTPAATVDHSEWAEMMNARARN